MEEQCGLDFKENCVHLIAINFNGIHKRFNEFNDHQKSFAVSTPKKAISFKNKHNNKKSLY